MPGLGELFENKLFLQMLSGAGAAMQRGDPISAGLDPITQSVIGAQSKSGLMQQYMKMLKEIIAGGGDIKMDKDTTSIKMPSSLLGGTGSELGAMTMEKGVAETGGLNPFAVSPTSFADFAGLTSKDVTQAFQSALGVEQLRADVPYKRALTRQAIAAAGRRPAGAGLDDPFYIPGPGERKLTLRQWNSLTTDQKEYQAYIYQAKLLDDKDIMSPREYRQTPITQRAQFLQEIIDDPALKDVAIELAKAGAPTIARITEVEKAKDVVGERAYLTDPKGLPKDIEKHLNSEDFQNRMIQLEPEDQPKERAREIVRFIENKIAASGAKIVDVTIDKGTMTWAIEFPDGETKEISYAVRP
jgi:hypothetical protein